MIQKVAFKTLGCKVNQYESESLRQAFIKNEFQVTEFKEKADIYIINTCAVTSEAERKSRQMIRKVFRMNPFATIIVTGCGVQSNLYDIKNCIDNGYIISNYYKEKIFSIIQDTKVKTRTEEKSVYFQPANLITEYNESPFAGTGNRIRGFVKIQDGCNQFCSYCVIPYLRGRSRSRSSGEIISEIHTLISNGYKEIVLLGINLGSYGNDLEDENINLAKLIKTIDGIRGIERIRLSSVELQWVTEELIDSFNFSQKLCHHLHIPLQSGDNNILSLMCRKYTSDQFETVVHHIRNKVTDIAITTDVIVGFPGENELSYERTYNFIKKIAFAKVHVFPYSDRPFNLATFSPSKVKSSIKKQRSQKVVALSQGLQDDFYKKNIGKNKNILIEYQKKNNNYQFAHGLTDNYIKVQVNIVNSQVKKGQIIKTKLKGLKKGYVLGKHI